MLFTAAVAVLFFDAAAAIASSVGGIAYSWAAVGSLLIYAGTAFVAARRTGNVWMGVLAAAAVGLVDSTAGWLISAWIGPGRPAGSSAHPVAIAAVIVTVPLMAGIVGLLGGLGARSMREPPPVSG